MCMWDGCDDSPTVSKAKNVTARKGHKCNECDRSIRVGETYHYVFQVYDGWPYQVHICLHCRVAQKWLQRECGGYLFDATWEDIAEHIREYPKLYFPLGRLMVGKNRKWEYAGQLMPIPPVPAISVHEYVQ